MKVKDFLSVCAFEPQAIKDWSGNIYLMNGRKCAYYENMEIHQVTNVNGYITIYLATWGYDGEYKPV